MLRLGHIEYSNCLPIHAQLLRDPSPDLEIVRGTPGELNRALDAGTIDVAPCSSIEYARHAGTYRLLPDVVIGSDGPVQSIRFESTRGITELKGARIAVPTASATSVVLLRILLELRFGVEASFEWYSQETVTDPIAEGCDAALWIGDLALRRPPQTDRAIYDLGALWTEWTQLPFAFALWQTRAPADHDDALHGLLARMRESRATTLRDPAKLAAEYTAALGLDPRTLADYWAGLRYDLDPRMVEGLLRYYRYAAELGEILAVPELRFV